MNILGFALPQACFLKLFLSLWLFNAGKNPATCGFWPCGSFSPCLVRFPGLGVLACNFLNTKYAIHYFSNSLGPDCSRILWFVTGCFCIIAAVKYSGTLSLHREINRLDEKFASWLFLYTRLMWKITECEEELFFIMVFKPWDTM